ncbi:MAG: hypothetical protein EON58_13500 [Alphaproteobacteria bacterium]|nr:MAG: hypothetical protein EON58_13500 [Alphaproteobacteria bacterium]
MNTTEAQQAVAYDQALTLITDHDIVVETAVALIDVLVRQHGPDETNRVLQTSISRSVEKIFA